MANSKLKVTQSVGFRDDGGAVAKVAVKADEPLTIGVATIAWPEPVNVAVNETVSVWPIEALKLIAAPLWMVTVLFASLKSN